MAKIQVLVIDDSAFMRKMVSDILEQDHRIKVIGTARNGEDGLEKIDKLKPDVITLDIEMPILDGISTLQKIMETNPIPVVMVSSMTDSGTMKTIQAMSKGAVDFISKPSGAISLNIELVKDEIISKVVNASQAKVAYKDGAMGEKIIKQVPFGHKKTIIGVGASTGGPRALEQLICELPKDFIAPILIVQHMPPKFTKSLADRLNEIADIKVKEAQQGEIISNGVVYIAPGNFHMTLRKNSKTIRIHLTKEPPKNSHRPSVDVLFNSMAQLDNYNKIAVILTGMGRDGANGITYLKEIDEKTVVITESKHSAIINGMPSAAEQTGHVNLTTHLNNIGKVIINLAR